MRIILIGFACSFKTSAGVILANKLHCKHIDTDRTIEAKFGKTVAQIFVDGESTFRNAETATLQSLTGVDNVIISCGGGSVLSKAFPEFVQNSTVVWLSATVDTVCARLDGTSRPLFDGLSSREIAALIRERDQYYLRYAAARVETDGLSPEEVALAIENKLFANK